MICIVLVCREIFGKTRQRIFHTKKSFFNDHGFPKFLSILFLCLHLRIKSQKGELFERVATSTFNLRKHFKGWMFTTNWESSIWGRVVKCYCWLWSHRHWLLYGDIISVLSKWMGTTQTMLKIFFQNKGWFCIKLLRYQLNNNSKPGHNYYYYSAFP